MEDKAFLRLKAQFELFGLICYYTDHWARMRVTSTPTSIARANVIL
jgi:hypothetical protein